MSGTSIDGIDAALVACNREGTRLLASHSHELPDAIKAEIASISAEGKNEIERLGPLDRKLGALFSEAALALLDKAGTSRNSITAIGSHGQTVRHRPPSAGHQPQHSFTLQLADPNTIAEETNITTVADFRRRDIAAGGEGAPLAPAFHAATMGSEQCNRAIVNIGGIANATILQASELVQGFDTGPGNTLLDYWSSKCIETPYDAQGAWSATGSVNPELLLKLQQHPYFALSGVRSTGKEAFNKDWLEKVLAQSNAIPAEDIQATLCELTAGSISKAVQSSGVSVEEVYICGGGVHNDALLKRLRTHFGPVPVNSTFSLGVDPDWVEAMAFAWLAARCIAQLPGNAPAVTGAGGERVLGGIYLA